MQAIKNLHEPAILQEILQRFDKLKPDAQRAWGKMDVSQMLAHCANALENTLGDKKIKQSFLGKILGGFAKKSITNDQPFKQGLPTDSRFVVADSRNFETEKQRLIPLIKRLSATDPEKLAAVPHSFFGKMDAKEWNALNYKHLDHHLRQFGA